MRWLFFPLLLVLAGCSGPQLPPEERVRELLQQAELAAEQRSIGLFSDRVAEAYQGEDGSGKRKLLRLLRGYFLSHQSIHLLVKIEAVESNETGVRARVYAGMAGSPVQGFEQLLATRAGLYRFELEFSRAEEPELVAASWRRADVQEVLPEL